MNFLEGLLYMIWRGIAIGVIISAPMGPVGILCVQRTLEKGRRTGFFTGVGAAISDLFYCILTGFGLSFIEEFLKANQNVIQIIGSCVLIVFGIYLFRSHPARKLKKPEVETVSKGKNILGGFLFTFSNPLIIFLIIGLFARFDFFLPEISFPLYVAGFVSIFFGALLWWWIVSYFVDKLRAHFNLRSMWLINKITGAIIMIFAVVGIVTAFTSSASAAGLKPRYYNSTRGFEPFGLPEPGAPLTLDNASADTLSLLMPLGKVENFNFSFRCANLHNKSGKRYGYLDAGSQKRNVLNPAWMLLLKNNDERIDIRFSTSDNRFDDLQPDCLDIKVFHGSEALASASVTEKADLFAGANAAFLSVENGECILRLGNRGYHGVLRFDLPAGFRPDSIGFSAAPGAMLEIDYIDYQPISSPSGPAFDRWSHFALEDVRDSYFRRSSDALEGEWEIFDYSLDEDRLKKGGDYHFVMVKSEEGYEMVYVEGAKVNRSGWQPGMTKVRLLPTAFRGVFDVEWLDPSLRKIEGEIKAQFSAPDILTLEFPGHSSSLRLRKLLR